MFKKLLPASLVLCLFALGITPLSLMAQADREVPESPAAKLEREGWRPVMEGVMQRDRGDGKIESMAFGAEGYAWMKKEHERELARLVRENAARPSKALLRGIRMFRREIAEIEAILASGQLSGTEKNSTSVNGCDISYGAHRNAYPLSTGGAGADSSAYLHNNCGYVGRTEAWSYAVATAGTVTTAMSQHDPRDGSWIDSTVSASADGDRNCYSEANAWSRSDALGIYYNSGWAYNYNCYPPLQSVAISGTSSTLILGYTCKTLTWTASVTGGAPAFSFTWTRDGVVVGYGGSYSQQFCGNDITRTEYVNLHVDVTDAAYASRGADFTTTINFTKRPVIENPCYPYRCTVDTW